MVPMKVLLVDAASDGHHGIYAARLMQGLRAENVDYRHMTSDEFNAELAGPDGEKHLIRKLTLASDNFVDRLICFTKTVWLTERTAYRLNATHVHYLAADALIMPLAFVLPWFSRDRIRILTIHWSTNVTKDKKDSKGLRHLYHLVKQQMFAWVCRFVDRVIVHGERSLNDLRTLAPVSSDILEVPYGTDIPRTHVSRNEARQALGLPLTSHIVLFFGAPRPDKGLDFLLDALEVSQIAATLVVAGTKGDEAIETRIASSTAHVVRRDGYVSDDEVGLYFAASDAVVLPYRPIFGGQSGPMTIAAAYGIPVVCTDVGDIGLTVSRYGFGLVVPPQDGRALVDALSRVLSAPAPERTAWATNGRAYASNTSWSRFAERVIRIYEAACVANHGS